MVKMMTSTNPPAFRVRPAQPEEAGTFFAQTPEQYALMGAIGCVRMDFGKRGTEFWHTWHPRGREELNSPEFKAELQQVVDTLRETVLKDLPSMRHFCYENGGKIPGGWSQNYGYVVETEHYEYCLRCNPVPGDYADTITGALERESKFLNTPRGFMEYYNRSDGVDAKVRSLFFKAEARNGKLWGVAECMVSGELNGEELAKLKDYIAGQASDGFGESVEQHEIRVGSMELYAHLWQAAGWSIQTEQECFAPKLAKGLPELCFSTLPSTGVLICIKRGESGYYPSDWNTPDRTQNRQIADEQNQRLGVTPAQEEAMVCGSMHGWNVPGADPAFVEEMQKKQEQTGGMTLA